MTAPLDDSSLGMKAAARHGIVAAEDRIDCLEER
jgi:hypothetical protein